MCRVCLFLHCDGNRQSFISLQLLQAQIKLFFLVREIPAKTAEIPGLDNVCHSLGSRDHIITEPEHLVHRTKASTLIMALMLFLRKLKDHICIPAAALNGISACVRIVWSLSKILCLSF